MRYSEKHQHKILGYLQQYERSYPDIVRVEVDAGVINIIYSFYKNKDYLEVFPFIIITLNFDDRKYSANTYEISRDKLKDFNFSNNVEFLLQDYNYKKFGILNSTTINEPGKPLSRFLKHFYYSPISGIVNYLTAIEKSVVFIDFINKIESSSKLKISADSSVSGFLDNGYGNINIIAVNEKQTILTIENHYNKIKFVVNLTNHSSENFSISVEIKSKEHLYELIKSTATSLRLYKEFSKYADYLDELGG